MLKKNNKKNGENNDESNNENKKEKKFGGEETAEGVVENLKKIKELDEEMEKREKKEKERMLQLGRQKPGRKEYSFKKDASKVFKRRKLKYFIHGGKGEKKMLKALKGIKGIKSKQEKEFARGLKKFADESVKVSTKPTTLKKITMINYLKELKKEKYGPLKRSQIRKIREAFFSGGGQKGISARGKRNAADSSQVREEKKFSVSRRVDKSFDDNGSKGRIGSVRRK